MARVLIWGASGHARVVAEAIELCGLEEIAAFIDETSPQPPAVIGASPVLRERGLALALKAEGIDHVVIAFGDCAARLEVAAWCVANGFTLASVVHPAAVVSPSAKIGAGSVVLAGAVIGTGAIIGTSVIVNTAATIDHDCTVGDGAHVSPGAHLGGNVAIGRGTWIGIGACIRNGLTVGDRTVIGAGAVVVKSLPPDVLAYGSPASIVRHLGV